MNKLIKIFSAIIVGVATLCVGACSGDEPGSGSETIDKNTPVADPTGTISLAMNNEDNGRTYLGNIFIGDDNNFRGDNNSGYSVLFSDLGAVAGLGNVTSIPNAGWASKVQVIPGHGYVAVVYYNYREERKIGDIYRIYVVDYITSIGGGIIGADIKYTEPFYGADVDISVDKTDITLSAEQTSVQVKITNKSFVPFEFSNSGDEFVVEPIYDKNAPFLITGMNIRCPGGTASAENRKGSVILTTESGKKTEINVMQAAAVPYIKLSQTEPITIDAQGLKEGDFAIDSNVAEDVEVSVSTDWIRVVKQDTDVWNVKKVWYVTSTNCSLKYARVILPLNMVQYPKRLRLYRKVLMLCHNFKMFMVQNHMHIPGIILMKYISTKK